MTQQIEVVFENGALRPLAPLSELREHQRYVVSVELPDAADSVPLQAVPSLEEVRRALAKIPGSLADAVIADREDR